MSHNRVVLFSGSTCVLFELPQLQSLGLLEDPTHTNCTPVWTYSFDIHRVEWGAVYRLLDTTCYSSGTVILTWSQPSHHFRVVLSADLSPPTITRLGALTFRTGTAGQIAHSRGAFPSVDGAKMMLITNEVGDSTCWAQFPHELRSLILPDEWLGIAQMTLDEGTGRICCTCFRRYKTYLGVVQARALANFIVVLDFM